MSETQQQTFDFKELATSELLVIKILEVTDEEPTQKEIIKRSRLVERTARHALEKLREKNIVNSRPALVDARQNRYSLTEEAKSQLNQDTAE